MAGQKIIKTTQRGITHLEIIENGNAQAGDEWALFRLTDDSLEFYSYGAEFAASIMSLTIKGKKAVEELAPRYATEDDARQARNNLPVEEKKRTLIRSVRPKH